MNSLKIVEKYPRLLNLLQRQFLLCKEEAICCIRDHKDGMKNSCEAISWSGRTPTQALSIAISNR